MSQFLVNIDRPQFVGPPRPPVTSWSLSALGCYEKCQLKARYKYVDRVAEARGAAASRGVDFHKDIELFLLGETTTLPEKLSYYHQWFTELKRYEIYPEHKIALKRDWSLCEWENPEVWYKGVLDLKVIRRAAVHLPSESEGVSSSRPAEAAPNEIIIYDWKTGKIYPDHHDQRTLYSVAAFAEHPTVLQVRAIHVYVDLRQLREETFHRDQMHELRKPWEDSANQFLEALKSPDGMIPNPTFHCNWCGYSIRKGGLCRF